MARVGRGVEGVAIDLQHAVRTEREKAIVGESEADGAVRARHQSIALLHARADLRRELPAVALDMRAAACRLYLTDVACMGSRAGEAQRDCK